MISFVLLCVCLSACTWSENQVSSQDDLSEERLRSLFDGYLFASDYAAASQLLDEAYRSRAISPNRLWGMETALVLAIQERNIEFAESRIDLLFDRLVNSAEAIDRRFSRLMHLLYLSKLPEKRILKVENLLSSSGFSNTQIAGFVAVKLQTLVALNRRDEAELFLGSLLEDVIDDPRAYVPIATVGRSVLQPAILSQTNNEFDAVYVKVEQLARLRDFDFDDLVSYCSFWISEAQRLLPVAPRQSLKLMERPKAVLLAFTGRESEGSRIANLRRSIELLESRIRVEIDRQSLIGVSKLELDWFITKSQVVGKVPKDISNFNGTLLVVFVDIQTPGMDALLRKVLEFFADFDENVFQVVAAASSSVCEFDETDLHRPTDRSEGMQAQESVIGEIELWLKIHDVESGLFLVPNSLIGELRITDFPCCVVRDKDGIVRVIRTVLSKQDLQFLDAEVRSLLNGRNVTRD